MKVLALDPGTRRVGVAVSDETGTLARPLAVIPAVPAERLVGEIAGLVSEHGVGEIVVGSPRRSRGEPGALAGPAEALAVELRRRCGVPTILRDEALTTVAAQEKLIEAGVRRRRRRASMDSAAAAVLLQAWLDEKRRGG